MMRAHPIDSKPSAVVKHCKHCVYFEGRERPTCSNPAANAKWLSYLVDETHIECIDARQSGQPCGMSGKLFERADDEELKRRQQQNYVKPLPG
jgi:hypothetical protein